MEKNKIAMLFFLIITTEGNVAVLKLILASNGGSFALEHGIASSWQPSLPPSRLYLSEQQEFIYRGG